MSVEFIGVGGDAAHAALDAAIDHLEAIRDAASRLATLTDFINPLSPTRRAVADDFVQWWNTLDQLRELLATAETYMVR